MVALGVLLTGEANPDKIPEKPYSIETRGTTSQVKTGADGQLQLVIKPATGYKISREAPLKIKLASDGCDLAKSALGQKDAHDDKSTSPKFAVSFKGKTAGAQTIDAKATFFVCNENLCERKTESVKVAVQVDP